MEIFFSVQSIREVNDIISGKEFAAEVNDAETADTDIATYVPSSLVEYQLPQPMVPIIADDGYDSYSSWWTDLYATHSESLALITDLIENCPYNLNETDFAKLQDIKTKIEKSYSISECLDLLDEADSIIAAYVPKVTYSSYSSSSPSSSSYGGNFKRDGVIYQNGWRYTWYSQRVLPGGGLSIPGRHVGEDGLIRDQDGYIVVASDDHSKGSEVDTPFGAGKVYDSGSGSGTLDIYTDY